MSVALTIDLDFFFDPVLRSFGATPLKSEEDRRRADSRQSLWMDDSSISELLLYLQSLHIGSCFHCVDKHNDSLRHICEAVLAGRLTKPFTLINLDGHSDLYRNQSDEDYDRASQIQCDQLSQLTDEASWVWVLHALWWIDTYIWIKPTPRFLSFALPELPRDYIEAQSMEVMNWIHDKSGTKSWPDEMCEGKEPQLLQKSYERLKATRFGRSFCIRVCKLDIRSLLLDTVVCVILCRSPGFTPAKADSLYDRIVASISV
jgi:hypothetical protein